MEYTRMGRIYSCLALVVILLDGVLALTCPTGATEFSGYCFIASKETAKYQHAQMYCLLYGCKVAIPDAAKKSALQGFGQANSLTNVIFGVLDSMSEGTFIEAPTGLVFADLDWETGRPSVNTNNNCVRINSLSAWKMADVSCTSKYNFICECEALA